jgi:hypothetical protein
MQLIFGHGLRVQCRTAAAINATILQDYYKKAKPNIYGLVPRLNQLCRPRLFRVTGCFEKTVQQQSVGRGCGAGLLRGAALARDGKYCLLQRSFLERQPWGQRPEVAQQRHRPGVLEELCELGCLHLRGQRQRQVLKQDLAVSRFQHGLRIFRTNRSNNAKCFQQDTAFEREW